MRAMLLSLVPKNIASAARALAGGGIVAFPTETVYGLGADAGNGAAVAALYALKGREADKPLQVMVADIEAARRIAEFTPAADIIAERFLPGPVTLVLQRRPGTNIAGTVHRGGDTVGIRIPQCESALALLRAFGGPVAATSANRAGKKPAMSGREVEALFAEEVAAILDAALPEGAQPSTVIDCSGEEALILREGAVKRNELEFIMQPRL